METHEPTHIPQSTFFLPQEKASKSDQSRKPSTKKVIVPKKCDVPISNKMINVFEADNWKSLQETSAKCKSPKRRKLPSTFLPSVDVPLFAQPSEIAAHNLDYYAKKQKQNQDWFYNGC